MKSVFLTTGFATVAQTARTEATKIFVARGTSILASPGFTVTGQDLILNYPRLSRYKRKCSIVNASNFDSALSHTRRSDASEKREENTVSTFGRFRLWTSFEFSLVSDNIFIIHHHI